MIARSTNQGVTRPRAALGAVVLALSVTGVALATGGGTDENAVLPLIVRPQFSAAAEDPAGTLKSLSTRFSVLDRAAQPSDELPRAVLMTIQGGLAQRYGAAPELSRRADVGGVALYLVPGRGHLCLFTETGVGGCNPAGDAVDGRLFTLEQGDPVPPGKTRLFGALPDNVSTVRLDFVNGDVVEAPVRGNVWMVVADSEPTHVSWVDDGVVKGIDTQ
jgi:hypothetical protein